VDWTGLDGLLGEYLWRGRKEEGSTTEEKVMMESATTGLAYLTSSDRTRNSTNKSQPSSGIPKPLKMTLWRLQSTPAYPFPHHSRLYSTAEVLRSPQSIHSPTIIKSNPSSHSIEQQFVSFHLKFLISPALIAQLVERVTSTY
jgi:hypothetical protein